MEFKTQMQTKQKCNERYHNFAPAPSRVEAICQGHKLHSPLAWLCGAERDSRLLKISRFSDSLALRLARGANTIETHGCVPKMYCSGKTFQFCFAKLEGQGRSATLHDLGRIGAVTFPDVLQPSSCLSQDQAGLAAVLRRSWQLRKRLAPQAWPA